MPTLVIFFAGFGAFGSTLIQLRFPGLPAGVSELFGFGFIALWALFGRPLRPLTVRCLLLLGVMIFGIFVGGVYNNIIGGVSVYYPQEYLAITYAALLALLLTNELSWRPADIIWVGWALLLVNIIHVVPLVLAFASIDIGASMWIEQIDYAHLTVFDRVDLFLEAGLELNRSNRYQGFSTNPNQLSLTAAAGAILFPWIASTIENARKTVWYTATVFSVLLVILTQGQTAVLACLFSLSLVLVRKVAGHASDGGFAQYRWPTLVGAWMLLSPMLFGVWRYTQTNASEDGDTASGRVPLWENAWKAIVDSRFIGYGPGQHSGYSGPFEGEEAHNLFLDVMIQGGLISLAALLVLLALVYVRGVKGMTLLGLALFSLFFIMGLSHFLLRHPATWMCLFIPVTVNSYYSLPASLARSAELATRRRRRRRSRRSSSRGATDEQKHQSA